VPTVVVALLVLVQSNLSNLDWVKPQRPESNVHLVSERRDGGFVTPPGAAVLTGLQVPSSKVMSSIAISPK